MERSCVQLEDLPDEILLIIFQNLYNCDVLYSFLGLNTRLDTILNDRIFTRNLTLIKPIHSSSYEFTDIILDRFCLEILPRINDKIERLNIESSFMERILLATNYPNLHTLGLYGFVAETGGEVFYEESYLIHRFQNQISSLFIQLKPHKPIPGASGFAVQDINIFIFINICNHFKNLRYLNFSSSSIYEQLAFYRPISTNFSSNLLELHVVVKTIYDCLCLLDGQLNQLHTFYVTIRPRGVHGEEIVGNDKKLLNLKCFSLIHEDEIDMYDYILVPLFQRMTNLEKLSLYFVNICEPIIDGEDLEKNIINHMPRLNEFTFNICSIICPHLADQPINLPSNDDIQHTFRNFQNSQIISSVYYFNSNYFYCHIYSYPYTWIFYHNIRNNFPGGLYKCVREISLLDERPFEHDFLLLIA
ncbi:unnamed protein product [Rotaria sordida]|uniref:F-box domain-containing protein n=2 Tax=Rotaria sordida TaxID=392033 RepID=A0A815T9A2_9BILA|nr:unnamed protein product [Rotaria sordida]